MKKVRPWLGLYLWMDGARLKEIEGQLDAQKEKNKDHKMVMNGTSPNASRSEFHDDSSHS